jgi:DNA-binding response OmpR family regulator
MKIRAAIIVIKDWKERAFLRAELIEEGIRTLAVQTMDEAEEWLSDPRLLPLVIIYDTQSQENTSEDIKRLSKYTSKLPVLILTSSLKEKIFNFKELGFKHVIRRPMSIGDVVGRVKEILRGASI